MFQLPKSLVAWNTPAFNGVLCEEIEQLDVELLPLQQGLTSGSYVVDTPRKAMVLGASTTASSIQVRAGVFYSSIIAGCNCADDPTPVDESAEYCEIQLDIDRNTAAATVKLLSD